MLVFFRREPNKLVKGTIKITKTVITALRGDFRHRLIGLGNQAAGSADSHGIQIFVEADAHVSLKQPVNGRLAKAQPGRQGNGGNRLVIVLMQKLDTLNKMVIGFPQSGRRSRLLFVTGKTEQDVI